MKKPYIQWREPIDELKDQPFWICWHACMLFLHEVLTYEEFRAIYDRHSGLPKSEETT